MKKEKTVKVNNGEHKTQMTFSLCHTTARLPDGWRAAIQMWRDRADHPELVEHILVADLDDFKSGKASLFMADIFAHSKCVINRGPRTCVAGWNLAAECSTGKFLINVADDLFPPEHWDTVLMQFLGNQAGSLAGTHGIDWDREVVLDVDTGAPNWAAAGGGGLLTFCFMTRKYYERYGYMLYPEYLTVYSDNDFTDQAKQDGVVVNARHIKFDHRHPVYDPNVKTDAVYENQSRSEAWEVGRKVYIERSKGRGLQVRKKIIVCLPGQQYSATWVSEWTKLSMAMTQLFDINPIFCYSTNVHVTRAALANAVVQSKPTPDYVLWIDDDNLLSVEQFSMMFMDLETTPLADSVSAWTWIAGDVYSSPSRISVGMFDERGDCKAMTYEEMQAADKDLIEVGWTGFPAILMRHEAIVKAGGHKAFQPYPAPGHPYGFYGEDSSFCINAKNNGVRMFVDRRIKVPHLKLQGVEPIIATNYAPAKEELAGVEA